MTKRNGFYGDPSGYDAEIRALASDLSKNFREFSDRDRATSTLLVAGYSWEELGECCGLPPDVFKEIQIEVSKMIQKMLSDHGSTFAKALQNPRKRNRMVELLWDDVDWAKNYFGVP